MNTDDKDKLQQAEEWIMTAPVGSEHWKAAWDHIRYMLGMEPRFPALCETTRTAAQAVADRGILAERHIDHGRPERSA